MTFDTGIYGFCYPWYTVVGGFDLYLLFASYPACCPSTYVVVINGCRADSHI